MSAWLSLTNINNDQTFVPLKIAQEEVQDVPRCPNCTLQFGLLLMTQMTLCLVGWYTTQTAICYCNNCKVRRLLQISASSWFGEIHQLWCVELMQRLSSLFLLQGKSIETAWDWYWTLQYLSCEALAIMWGHRNRKLIESLTTHAKKERN